MNNPGVEDLVPPPQHVHYKDKFERLLLLGLVVTEKQTCNVPLPFPKPSRALHTASQKANRDLTGHIFVRVPYLEGKKASVEAI